VSAHREIDRESRRRVAAALSLEHDEIFDELIASEGQLVPGSFQWRRIRREAEFELIARNRRVAEWMTIRFLG
jgi:hypothetical protein